MYMLKISYIERLWK